MDDKPSLPDAVFADLDRASGEPLYLQVANRLEQAIAGGALGPGDRIDNEIEISERIGLNRLTVRRAIQTLVDKGLLVRRKGAGTQVVQGAGARHERLSSLFDDLERQGRNPTTKVLNLDMRPAPEYVSDLYRIPHGSHVVYIRRVRFADGQPMAVFENYLAPAFQDLTVAELEATGLNRILRARGLRLRLMDQRVKAVGAPLGVANHLGVGEGTAILAMRRDVHDHTGVAVDSGLHHYHPDMELSEVRAVDG